MGAPVYLAVQPNDLLEDAQVTNADCGVIDTKPRIQIHGRHFVDEQGRVLHLRGANVGSASKVPSSDPAIDIPDPTKTSYINRPFSVEEAPEHWRRLKRWGLGFLRITVTWEAVEHGGPGVYDEEYLGYLRALLQSMTDHGLLAYVCLHQDVWSRHSGGSGAPAWTLEYAGLDLFNEGQKLEEAGAAYLGGVKSRGKPLEGDRGLWPTGYQKLSCATMNTLFWAGKTLAPHHLVDDPTSSSSGKVNIQDFLQERFMAMFEKLVHSVGDIEGVVGFEMMNEPHPGYIGMKSMHDFNYNTDLHLGDFPSPLQSFALGDGHAMHIPHYTRSWPHPTRNGRNELVNPRGISVWKDGCPWAREGVWAWDRDDKKPVVLREGYFAKTASGEDIDFYNHFYWPFVKRWETMVNDKTAALSGDGRAKMVMVEGVPNEFCPEWPESVRPSNLVFTPHWYDLNTMFMKQFGFMTVNVQRLSRLSGLRRALLIWSCLHFGKEGARNNYRDQIGTIVAKAREKLGDVPVIMGETGLPMDMNGESAFRTDDWRWHEIMVDALCSAYDSAMIGYNLWAYNPHNKDLLGDDWNSENFSWFSEERAIKDRGSKGEEKGVKGKDLDVGARLLRQIVRPYALRTAGIPLTLSYDSTVQSCRFRFTNPKAGSDHPPITTTETVLFIPASWIEAALSGKLQMFCSDGTLDVDVQGQRVVYHHTNKEEGKEHWVVLHIRDGEIDAPVPPYETTMIVIGSVLTLIVAILLATKLGG